MPITRRFTVYTNAGVSVPPVIHVNQYDRGETWIFTLLEPNGSQYIPASGGIVGIKADGHAIINTATVNSNGEVVVSETQQMTAAAGKAVYEIIFDNSTHGTANFIVCVEPKPGDNATLSDSDLSLIQEAIESTIPANIEASVQDWMDDNLAPSQWVIDNTLSIAGAAADAKKTGDGLNELKTIIDPIREDLLGANITPLNEFYKVTSGITYSVDSANDAVTITCTSGTYQALSTQNILPASLTVGKKYKAHFKAETVSGTPAIRMAIRGVNGNQDGIAAGLALNSDGEGEFEFVADSYMKYVSLFVVFSTAQSCAVKYSEVWVKEIEDVTAIDKIAREANEKFTFENPINRFNKNDPLIVSGKMLQYSGVVDYTGSCYTHPIPIEAGKKYSFMFSGNFYGDTANSIVRYCNADGTLYTGSATVATVNTSEKWGKYGTFTAGNYTAFVCVNVRATLLDTFMFVEGETIPDEYLDYFAPRYNVADDIGFGELMQNDLADSVTNGGILAKKNLLMCFDNITCIGDSLTYSAVFTGSGQSRQAKRPYPSALGVLTGATTENVSEGGVSASQWWASYNSRIVSKTNQLVIVYLGTNGGLTDTLETDAPEGTDYSTWANTNTGCYAKIVAKAIEAGARVLLVKVYEPNSINDVIEQIADRFECGIVGNYKFTDPIYHLYPNGTGSDSVHYNDLGYVAFATYLIYQVSLMDYDHMKNIIPL